MGGGTKLNISYSTIYNHIPKGNTNGKDFLGPFYWTNYTDQYGNSPWWNKEYIPYIVRINDKQKFLRTLLHINIKTGSKNIAVHKDSDAITIIRPLHRNDTYQTVTGPKSIKTKDNFNRYSIRHVQSGLVVPSYGYEHQHLGIWYGEGLFEEFILEPCDYIMLTLNTGYTIDYLIK